MNLLMPESRSAKTSSVFSVLMVRLEDDSEGGVEIKLGAAALRPPDSSGLAAALADLLMLKLLLVAGLVGGRPVAW